MKDGDTQTDVETSDSSAQTSSQDPPSTSDAGTQSDLGIKKDRVIPGRQYVPPTVEDIAKRAAVGNSVIMSEIDSDDFLGSVQDLIDHVQTRAWPALEKNALASEQVLAEQIEDISFTRLPMRKMESKIREERERLSDIDKKIRAAVAALDTTKGGTRDDKKGKGKGNGIELQKWKYAKQQEIELLKAEAAKVREDIIQLEDKVKQIRSRFSSVPNESVYTDAFSNLAASVSAYADDVRAQAAKVMRTRRDGPLLRIDKDAFEQVADALGSALTATEEAFKDLLTYTSDSGGKERGTIKLYDGSLEVDMKNVENTVDLELQAGRLAVYERIRINRYNAVNAAIRDMESVHREIAKRLTKPVSFRSSIDQFDIGMLYALKLSRMGLIYAASHIATRVFNNVYVDRMSSKDPDIPDLKWVVFAFVIICVLFDMLVVGIAYMISKTLPSQLDMRLVKDFAVDTVVAHTMSAMSLFPLADVIQDKRHFEYQITAMRALRLMRDLCFSVEGFHAATPYFYLTGPFYIQHKKSATEDVL